MEKWTDYLDGCTYLRLCDCVSTKADIRKLVNAKWLFMKETGKDKEGFTKEDALVQILELLDANSQWELADLTPEEYHELMQDV